MKSKMANTSANTNVIPSPKSGSIRQSPNGRGNHKLSKGTKGVYNNDSMYYSSRNKAFLRNLSRRATSQSFPIACNPHYSLLQLAYKLRVAEKAMYGNKPNVVAGQIPIPYSNASKSSLPLPFRRNTDSMNTALSKPSSVKRHGEGQKNSLWPVLIGARGSEHIDFDESILEKYKKPLGETADDDGDIKMAQPLSSTEVENIVQSAINCVINSKRQKPVPDIFQSASGVQDSQTKGHQGLLSIASHINGHSVLTAATEGIRQATSDSSNPSHEPVNTAVMPSQNTTHTVPCLTGTVRKHRCPMCEYETDNKSHLRRHQSSVHRLNVPYICYICKREFPRSEKVKYHFERVHPGMQYDPKACRKDAYEGHSQSTLSDDSDSDDSSTQEEISPNMRAEGQNYIPCSSTAPAVSLPVDQFEDKPRASSISPSKMPVSALSPTKMPADRYNYKCPQCAYLGRDIWHLRRHMSDCHSISKQFHCSQCSYATSRRHRMVSHMKLHGKLVCMYCDHASEDLEGFQEHLRICSSTHRASLRASQFLCKHCNTVMPNRTVLRKHLAMKHSIFLQSCHMCNYSTQSIDEFEQHLIEHSVRPEKISHFACKACNQIFDSEQALEKHAKKEHSVPVKNNAPAQQSNSISKHPKQKAVLSCSICDYQTQHKAVMKSHLKKHQEACEREECSYPGCTFTTSTGRVMEKHINKCHREEEILEKMQNAKGIFPCPVCVDRPPFRYRKSFEKHMDTHKKEERCPLCDESFYTFDLLKKHITGDHEAEVEEVTDSEDEGVDTKFEAPVLSGRKRARSEQSDKQAELHCTPPKQNKQSSGVATSPRSPTLNHKLTPVLVDVKIVDKPKLAEENDHSGLCKTLPTDISSPKKLSESSVNGALVDHCHSLMGQTEASENSEEKGISDKSQASLEDDDVSFQVGHNNNASVFKESTTGDRKFDHSYAATARD